MLKDDKERLLSETVFTEVLQAFLQKEIPFRFKAAGQSMSPFIKDGDQLTVSSLSNKSPRFGDVVVCIHPESKKLIIHRLIGKKSSSYMIKGDNTYGKYDLIPGKNILGKVSKVERNGRRVFFGAGFERILIAFLNRSDFHLRILLPTWQRLRPYIKRSES